MSLDRINLIPAAARYVALAALYSGVLFAALFLSMLLRFDFAVPPEFMARFWRSAAWIIPAKLVLLAAFGQFRSLLTYFSLPEVSRLAAAMAAAALLQIAVWFATGGTGTIPRGVIVSDLVFSFVALLGLRTAMRIYRERLFARHSAAAGKTKKVIIVGAGTAGSDLCRELQSKPGIGLEVVAFVDDDPKKIGNTLHGKPVCGPRRRLAELAADLDARKIIIAMPGVAPAVIKDLVWSANQAGIEHDILPSVSQLLHREVTVSHVRHVEPEDLLNRPAVKLDVAAIGQLFHGRSVMVTGAGGTIGSELCRQLADQTPAKLILVDRSEHALFLISEELALSHRHIPLVALASDVGDEPRMDEVFATHKPSFVFHAAAHKHVPLMESQPAEAVRNNAVATAVLARQAQRHGANRFILVSTDKAVNPTSVMGATKRIAEMIIEEYHKQPDNECIWCAVRFGNVLGSSGSVVPIFRRQIAQGGPLTLTHPDATRYFMSVGEAVGLILQSALQAEGGEIFILDMGEPVKIHDLARQMIELSGFQPDKDIKIVNVGFRPGEKLFEEAIHMTEDIESTQHPKVRRLRQNGRLGSEGLVQEMHSRQPHLEVDQAKVRAWLHDKVPEYRNGTG